MALFYEGEREIERKKEGEKGGGERERWGGGHLNTKIPLFNKISNDLVTFLQ